MKKVIKEINAFLKRLKADNLGVYTAQSAYFTFLSFIPFIILLLSLIKYINIDKETLEYILVAIVPNIAKSNVLNIIQEVYSKSIETISISIIFLLWSAAKSFYSLSLGLSAIYKSEKRENHILLRLRGIAWTVIIIAIIVMTLLLIVFGNTINNIIQEHFTVFSNISDFILDIRVFLVIGALFITFLLMYRFIPNKKGNKIKNQIPGAIFASIRLVCNFIFFLNLCRCFYKFFYYIWKFGNSNFNYDVVICNNLFDFAWRRNKCNSN